MTFRRILFAIAAVGIIVALATVATTRAKHSSSGSEAALATADSGANESNAVIRFAKNPEPMAPFAVNDLNGASLSTASLKGKVLILSFWATWCKPCREEIPQLNTLATRFKDQVQIIGISEDDDPPSKVKAFVQRVGFKYTVVMADKEITAQFGDVPALPTNYIVDPNGGVVQKHVGLYPIEVYDREIRALLKMPVNATIETFEDTGQVFLKNAARATELPGVDLSHLTPDQKRQALKRMNAEGCNCGCKLTIAQCRINDSSCEISKKLAENIVQQVASKAPASSTIGKTQP